MSKPDSTDDLDKMKDIEEEEQQDAPEDDPTPDEGDQPEEDESEDTDSDDDEDKPLGPKGEKALAAFKAKDRDQRRKIRDLEKQIAELRKGDSGEEDELSSTKKDLDAMTQRAVAAEKRLAAKMAGLPDSYAKRLEGDDFEDFLDDAEALAADLPTPQGRKGGGGAKEGHQRSKKPSLDDQIADAEKKGDLALARRLKAQKLTSLAASL